MHSHDRTLLAKLGFSDPDKKDRTHDLACQYLTRPEVLALVGERVVKPVIEATRKPLNFASNSYDSKLGGYVVEKGEWFVAYKALTDPRLEVAISKGDGQYKTTIGFIDVECTIKGESIDEGKRYLAKERGGTFEHEVGPFREVGKYEVQLGIEVKIAPVGIGDLIRQIKLYDEYVRPNRIGMGRIPYYWLAATRYELSARDVASLKAEGILHIRLGGPFERWLSEQNTSAAPSDSVEV